VSRPWLAHLVAAVGRRLNGGRSKRADASAWRRAQEVLAEVLDADPTHRRTRLAALVAGDEGLRREVETLLAGHERAGPLDDGVDALLDALAHRAGPTVEAPEPYDLLERLGGGAMGVVYRAHDRRLQRSVALKFLAPDLGSDAEAARRFLAEARAAAALEHPNLCTVLEAGATRDGRLFLAMPFYDGETLRARVARGPVAAVEAADIAAQIARGLAKAHENGIVHRDVKPANVIVTRDGLVKILDFGIAKLSLGSVTATGGRVGTVAYMSPEQARGEPVDGRTDLWSLGVVLYEMLAGERPFRGEREHAVLRQILDGVPTPLARLRPDLPPALVGLVEGLMARRPEDRPSDARAVAAALAESVVREGVSRIGPAVEVPAGPAAISERGERRTATILAAGVEGFALLLERLGPGEQGLALARLEALARTTVARHGGALNEFTGERIVALFGVPRSHEDDALRAVRAARELADGVRTMGDGLGRTAAVTLRLHAGIDAGPVVVQRGDDPDRPYRVVGEAERVATRLAASAAADEIWLSPEARRPVAPFVRSEPTSPVRVRDRAAPIVPHRLLGVSETRSRIEAVAERGLTPHTGRAREMAALRECLAQARAGSGRLVPVLGEAGLGKSRLLHEFRLTLDPAEVAVRVGRCPSYSGLTSYVPFIEVIRGILGLGEGSAADAPVDESEVASRIRAIAPELEEFLPLYLHLLAVTKPEHAAPGRLQGEQFRLAMQEAIAALLTLDARRRPTVLFLEDWHWVDDASHAVLAKLAELVHSYPLLVVVTARPGPERDRVPTGARSEIVLEPLDRDAGLAMIRSVLRAAVVPEELGARLHERTGGNPFFLEEMAEALLEEGTVRVVDDRAVLTGALEGLDLPDTVQAVIRSRVDRVDANAREVLRVASVIGREFGRGLLHGSLADASGLSAALDTLKGAALIQQTRLVPDPVYRFKHVLTQDVVYSSLLEHQRRELHGRVGASIEAMFEGRLGEQLERMAHHFSRAGMWRAAVDYGLRSAERAEGLNQFPEALQILERTQRWLFHVEEKEARRATLIELLLRQERLCETLGKRGRQQRLIDELVGLLEPTEDRQCLAEVYVRQGDVYTLQRRFEGAEAALRKALAIHHGIDDGVGKRSALRSLGLLRWHEGRHREALAHIESALAIDRERNDPGAIVGDLSNLGNVLKALGEHEEACGRLHEALALADAAAGSDSGGELALRRSFILHNLANVHREMGQPERALEYLDMAIRLSLEKRLPIQLSYHYTAAAHIQLQLGRVERSLEQYRSAVELTRRANFAQGLAQSLRILGDVLAGLGRAPEALPLLEEAASLFAQLRDGETEATVWGRLAAIHESSAAWAEALAAWARARDLRRQAGDAAGELEALEGLARAARHHLNAPSLALEHYEGALQLASTVGDSPAEARLRNTLGILEWERGRYKAALGHYEIAHRLLDGLGDGAGAGLALNSLAVTLRALGRGDEARERLEEALALHRANGQRRLEGHATAVLGDLCHDIGDGEGAVAYYTRSLTTRHEIGDRRGAGWMLHHLARAHHLCGSTVEVAACLAAAEEVAGDIQDEELSEACALQRRGRG
jgi:tetratricopeptide (TPR) repeat protein/class 3 adenylate cyclase